MKKIFTLSLALVAALAINAQETKTVTFEAAQLAEDGTLKGTSYEEAGFVFDNYYTNEGYEYNSGYTVSACTDRNTAGFGNQYSADARGGAEGSKQFLIYNPCYYGDCYIHRADNASFTPNEVSFALTTYVAISTQEGDAYAKKFGEGDFYTLTVKGLDAEGNELKSIDVKLIDYPRSWMPWATADLSELGEVNKLLISFSSSDMGQWGMNTPAYIALDNFTATVKQGDAINKIQGNASEDKALYTLAGQRVEEAKQSGLYIVNGKKVLVK